MNNYSEIHKKLLILAVAVFVSVATFWNATSVTKAAMVVNRTVVQATSTLNWGLVGHWTFDGADTYGATVLDKNPTATKNNGTKTGTLPVTGKFGQALKFNGSSSNIDLGAGSSLQLTHTGTLSAWVKRSSTGTHDVVISNNSFRLDRNGYLLGILNSDSTNKIVFEISNGATTNQLQSDLTITADGLWHHIVGTWDGSTLRVYRDGVEGPNTISQAIDAVSGTYNPYVGRDGEGNAYYFDGGVDDARIYNRALSATEVASLYNLGVNKQAITANKTFTQATSTLNWGLVGNWTFDAADMYGNTVLDRNPTATKNHGTKGATPFPLVGKLGQALKFNGSGDYITVTQNTPINSLTSLSLSFWMKPSALSGSTGIFSKDDGNVTSGDWWVAVDSSGNLEFVKELSSANIRYSVSPPTLNNWTHVVVSWDGSTTADGHVIIYYNGVARAMVAAINGSGSGNGGQDLWIGKGRGGGSGSGGSYNGLLDNIHLYNRALSATEVTQLYNQGAKKSAVTANMTPAKTTLENDTALVGWWTMDGKDIYGNTVIDKNPNATKNNGTKTGTVSVAGKLGQSLKFNGSSYVEVPDSDALDPVNITVSFWIKRNGSQSSYARIMDKHSQSSASYQLYFYGTGNNFGGFLNGVSGNTGDVDSTFLVPDGVWTHLVMTYDGSYMKFYGNGVLSKNQAAAFGNIVPGNTVLRFGTTDAPSPAAFMVGLLDDVRIYNRALSATEITTLYRYGR